MARPKKTSLRYFPFDVDFFESDIMVYIAGEFGLKGEMVTVRLLCAVYRKGYFLEWTDLVKYKLKKDLPGISATLLDQIVARLVKWDFFNKELFDSSRILTSVEIQQCYFEATKRCVKMTGLPYLLIDSGQNNENTSETTVNAAETPVNATETPQIKENKTKTEKTKIKKTVGDSAHTCATSMAPAPIFFEKFPFLPPSADEVADAVRDPTMQRYGPTLTDARAFFDHYSARGWIIGNTPMRDWRAAFRSWLAKKSRFGDPAPKSAVIPNLTRPSEEKPRLPEEPYTPPSPEFFKQLDRTAPWNAAKREA